MLIIKDQETFRRFVTGKFNVWLHFFSKEYRNVRIIPGKYTLKDSEFIDLELFGLNSISTVGILPKNKFHYNYALIKGSIDGKGIINNGIVSNIK